MVSLPRQNHWPRVTLPESSAELATAHKKTAVPYAHLHLNQEQYIDPKYIPNGVVFEDPRNMKQSHITAFFHRIAERQLTHPLAQVFRFKGASTGRRVQDIQPARYPDEIDKEIEDAADTEVVAPKRRKPRTKKAKPPKRNVALANIQNDLDGLLTMPEEPKEVLPPMDVNAAQQMHAAHPNQMGQHMHFGEPMRFGEPMDFAEPMHFGQQLRFADPVPFGQQMHVGQQMHIGQQQPAHIGQPVQFGIATPQPLQHMFHFHAHGPQNIPMLPPNPPGPIDYLPNMIYAGPPPNMDYHVAQAGNHAIDPVLLNMQQTLALPTPRPSATPTPNEEHSRAAEVGPTNDIRRIAAAPPKPRPRGAAAIADAERRKKANTADSLAAQEARLLQVEGKRKRVTKVRDG